MKTVPTTVWLTNPGEVNEKAWNFYAYTSNNMSHHGWYRVGEALVEFTPPTREEVVPKVVEALRAQQAEVRAEAELRVQGIQQDIDRLLCIEYVGEAREVPSTGEDDIHF